MIMTMLALAPSAMAGQPRPPDYLCLEWQSDSSYHHLSFRQIGRIYDKNFRIKTYAITGRDQFGLISGSAYVERGSKTLVATYSGMHTGHIKTSYDLTYELNTEIGTIDYRYDNPPDNTITTGTDTVNRTKCKKLNIPSKDDE
jgi:hypothetical protein